MLRFVYLLVTNCLPALPAIEFSDHLRKSVTGLVGRVTTTDHVGAYCLPALPARDDEGIVPYSERKCIVTGLVGWVTTIYHVGANCLRMHTRRGTDSSLRSE